jgi:diguanylate cyclase (GGDEF)-like protein
VTQELPLISVELGTALAHDQHKLRTEVLLWQRWVRYLALGALVLLTLTFGSTQSAAGTPMTALALGYVVVVMTTAWLLQRPSTLRIQLWFPSLLVTADVVTLAGFAYLTSPPGQFYRLLILLLMTVQLGVFYFGRRNGSLAAALGVAVYLVMCLVAPPFVAGPAPAHFRVIFDATLFAIVSAVLIWTFGSFRERMNALRMYCKVVEEGEMASVPELGNDRWPDELTLLARSFDAMRIRLAEELGTDPLTGCLNRRALETRLRADLRHARRRSSSVAIAAIDVDNFKQINDTLGHPVGDRVLQQVVGIMKGTARDTDAVARVGGDEFLIVLPDTGWQGALTFAERLRRHVDDFSFGLAASAPPITISVGVAMAQSPGTVSPESLIADADRALYQAKTAGRNRVFA